MRDDELVAASRAGDPEAFAALVARHRSRVEAVVGRLVGDESEDLVQEALLRAYVGLSQLRDSARFGAWLCGIAVNLAKTRLRRRALEARVAGALPVVEQSEDRAVLELVRDAVDVLPVGQREVVLMHYAADLSCDEIAAVVGTTPGAVRVRLHRAREQLRTELAVLAPVDTSEQEAPMLEMTLDDVYVRVAEDDPQKLVAAHRILVLAETEGERVLPIWVGAPEGDALAFRLTGETTQRPLTSDLLVEVLRATGAGVERVAITEVREKTFYGSITLALAGRSKDVDARPSDALNVAVRVGAPIFVAKDVLEGNSVTREDLAARLDDESHPSVADLSAGRWHSLSAELLRSLYRTL